MTALLRPVRLRYTRWVRPQARVDEIVAEVATAYFTRENFERVMSEPAIDSQGEESLRIMIVIKQGAVDRLKGDPVLDTLVAFPIGCRKPVITAFH